MRLDGTPSGSADPDGSATLDVPVGARTITVLPEPSGLLALTAGAISIAGVRARRRGSATTTTRT
ncbi:MAG: PEP-CTERM sorting domain-containing protein [Candidatus Eisenbacteria bacterium]|uniref:PEP-CTERM sorting domain-containing protein n=1 Tax=Eiseniibacteriota bacterium TaxID=2212470 RepID=A0A538UDA2_UNCEI|nr:MAG: PEP-CTERM sorting domain-containing protein [Candidatus Eisenbacteria bacterium]